jgi:hypothetical protein
MDKAFEYHDSLTHLDASELPGSRTVPHPSGQFHGIWLEPRTK